MIGLRDAVWPDVDAADRRVLILPVGALEQHGPHLPLDTDTALAEAVAAEVARRRTGCQVAPPVPFGSSGEHAGFPGTVSIGTDALASVVVEIVRDSSRWWEGVLVVNGHGGNLEALRRAQGLCRYEGRSLAVAHLALPGMDAHAGRSETSLMLYLDPGRVQLDAARPGRTEPVQELMGELQRHGVRAVSVGGVLGDPTGADAAHGEEMFQALVRRALTIHDAMGL